MVNDGAESAVFKQLFQRWSVKGQTVGMGTTNSPGKIAKFEQIKFDATSMHARPDLAAQQKMVDDGTGEAEGGKSYKELKAELGDATDIIQITVDRTTYNSTQKNSKNIGEPLLSPTIGATFPVVKLLNCQTEDLHDGVDPTKKEEYLSNEDFALILGVSRVEIYSVPTWKQQNLKKEKGLF